MRLLILVLAAFVAVSFAPAAADEPADQSPELKVLNRMIGTWDEVMTNKATEWTPKAERSTSVTKRTWALGGRFLRGDGVWQPAKAEFINLVTYDSATKEYRNWYFSAGVFPRGINRGTWDEKGKTLTWMATDEFGNKSVGKTKFIDDDTFEWTVVTSDPQGKVVLDLQAKNTRRKK